MIGFRGSNANAPSPNCRSTARRKRQDNVDWVAEQARSLTSDEHGGGPATLVLLLGGIGMYHFRLRVAQSHLRADLTPSAWSHAALLLHPERDVTPEAEILESSLEPWEGFEVASTVNGLQVAPLSRYADPVSFPNVALIRVPVDPALWRDQVGGRKSVLAQFANQRAVLDVPGLLLEWLAYAWCAGGAANPLVSGHGVPSAAVIESLVGAVGYDVSPGIDTAASSPEALWQTAQWWQEYLEDLEIAPMHTRFSQELFVPGPVLDTDDSRTAGLFQRG